MNNVSELNGDGKGGLPRRFHGFDSLRATAMVLGVVLHGVVAHTTVFSYAWPVQDVSRSSLADLLFHWIHSFRMPLFFLLSGFLARFVVERKGWRFFLKRRWKRVGLPLLLALVTLAPITKWAEEWARSYAGGLPVNIFDPRFWGDREEYIAEISSQNGAVADGATPILEPSGAGTALYGLRYFSLSYLWFLYYLLVFACVTPLILRIGKRFFGDRGRDRIDRLFRRFVPTTLAPLLLALPAYPFLFCMFATGIGTPFAALVPFPLAMLLPELNFYGFYYLFFLFGWFLHRQTALLDSFVHVWPRWMTVGVLCFGVAHWITQGLDFNPWQQDFWQRRLIGLGFYSVATAGFCLGWMGVFQQFFNRDSASWRFLSDASYWIYLVHLPLIFVSNALIAPLPWHWTLKLVLNTAVITGICVVTYRYWVRHQWLGRLLHGDRAEGKQTVPKTSPDSMGSIKSEVR